MTGLLVALSLGAVTGTAAATAATAGPRTINLSSQSSFGFPSSGAGGGCSVVVMLYVPAIKDATYAATVSATNIAVNQFAIGPPYSQDTFSYGAATFRAPAGVHQIPIAGISGHDCSVASQETSRNFKVVSVTATVPGQFTVSGKVTEQGTGTPAAGVSVGAHCAGGGSTTTGPNGTYEFVVDRGPCTIAPRVPRGETALPADRRFDVTHDIKGVDFGIRVACPLTASDTSTAARGAHARAAAGPQCLFVTITVSPKPTPGLSFPRSGKAITPGFLGPADSAGDATCRSGCANVVVRVTDARGQPVQNARVSVSVTPFHGAKADYGEHAPNDDGHLCRSAVVGLCGEGRNSFLDNLAVDATGRARLLYWMPGAILAGTVDLTAQATAPCATCSGGQDQSRKRTHAITITPHQVWHKHIELPGKDLVLFTDWAKNGAMIPPKAETINDHVAGKLLDAALKALAGELGAQVAGQVIGELGKDGFAARYGRELESLEKHGRFAGRQAISLTIDEVSFCPLNDDCGPAGITDWRYLYFDFRAGTPTQVTARNGQGSATEFRDHFTVGYNATLFANAQGSGFPQP